MTENNNDNKDNSNIDYEIDITEFDYAKYNYAYSYQLHFAQYYIFSSIKREFLKELIEKALKPTGEEIILDISYHFDFYNKRLYCIDVVWGVKNYETDEITYYKENLFDGRINKINKKDYKELPVIFYSKNNKKNMYNMPCLFHNPEVTKEQHIAINEYNLLMALQKKYALPYYNYLLERENEK